MANVKISQLPNFTGNTQDAWLIMNNDSETETFKARKQYFFAAAGFSWNNPGTGGNYPSSDQYGNLQNNSDNYLPFNTTIFNNNTDVFELVNSGSVAGTLANEGARVYIKVPGIYQISCQIHLFDLGTNQIDLLVKLSSSSSQNGTMSPLTLLHDYKSNDGNGDQLMNGLLLLDVTSPTYYSLAVNPSANTPFPSNNDSTPSRWFFQKIS